LTEAQMIVESLHLRTLPLERRADLENEWASQCEEFAKNGWRKYRRPCSFLDNLSMCNVYKTRPFVCRIYNSKDVDDCKNNGCADVVSIPWDKMFARLAHIEHAMHRSGEATQESIAEANKRYFLPAAMLYVTCALYQAGIPDVFLHKPSEVQP
jgi:Fe-S-cluster containining protein